MKVQIKSNDINETKKTLYPLSYSLLESQTACFSEPPIFNEVHITKIDLSIFYKISNC